MTHPVRFASLKAVFLLFIVSCSSRQGLFLVDPAFQGTAGGEIVLAKAGQSAARLGITIKTVILPETDTESSFFKRLETFKGELVLVSPLLLSLAEGASDQFPDISFVVPLAERVPEKARVYASIPDRENGFRRLGGFMAQLSDAYAAQNGGISVAGGLFSSEDRGESVLRGAFSELTQIPYKSGLLPPGKNGQAAQSAVSNLFADNIDVLFVSGNENTLDVLSSVPESGVLILLEAAQAFSALHPGIVLTVAPDYGRALELALGAWKRGDPGLVPVPMLFSPVAGNRVPPSMRRFFNALSGATD